MTAQISGAESEREGEALNGSVPEPTRKKTRGPKPCRRCGGDKGQGVRGVKFCPPCRDAMEPIWKQANREQSRRRAAEASATREKRPSELAPPGTKWCHRCQQYRPVDKFRKSATRRSGRESYCLPCTSAYLHEHRLRKEFGLTAADYDRLLELQDGRCAICLKQPRKQRLAVDHRHGDGVIRGLLCSRCNHKVLGGANESPALLRRAAAYLERPPALTGESPELLGHHSDQAEAEFAETSESLAHGELAYHNEGELVAVTLRTFAALAATAGVSITIAGETFEPPPLTLDDELIVNSLTDAARLGGARSPRV